MKVGLPACYSLKACSVLIKKGWHRYDTKQKVPNVGINSTCFKMNLAEDMLHLSLLSAGLSVKCSGPGDEEHPD